MAEAVVELREESRGLPGRREPGRGPLGRRDRVEDRGGVRSRVSGLQVRSRVKDEVDEVEEEAVERVVDVVSSIFRQSFSQVHVLMDGGDRR